MTNTETNTETMNPHNAVLFTAAEEIIHEEIKKHRQTISSFGAYIAEAMDNDGSAWSVVQAQYRRLAAAECNLRQAHRVSAWISRGFDAAARADYLADARQEAIEELAGIGRLGTEGPWNYHSTCVLANVNAIAEADAQRYLIALLAQVISALRGEA